MQPHLRCAFRLLAGCAGMAICIASQAAMIGPVNMGNLTDGNLFFFANAGTDANWQGATNGYAGNVVVSSTARQRTSGSVPYAGTIYTDAPTVGAWQSIVNASVNSGQAFSSTNQVAKVAGLRSDLVSAIQQINALPATPGFESVSTSQLNGLNTQDGIDQTYVINVTSGLSTS